MKSIEELGRINKIEGSVFISFDMNELVQSDEVACGGLRVNQPEYILPSVLDVSSTLVTMRYSVPDDFTDIVSDEGTLEIDQLIRLYEKILFIMEDCEDCFLQAGGICLELPYVYINKAHDTLKFLYIPEQKTQLQLQDVKHLMISLIEKCEETSGGAIQLQLYKYFYKPKFDFEEFKEMLRQFKASEEVKNNAQEKQLKLEMDLVNKVTQAKVEETTQKGKTSEDKVGASNEQGSGRIYYRHKVYPSQLSQEEVEEMVQNIYKGKPMEGAEEKSEEKEEAERSGNMNVVPEEGNVQSASKRKNIFDNVFNQSKVTPKSVVATNRVAALKSISVHTRYDLPKQIEIRLVNEQFTIGRATRTGEPTGADYEFGAEVTPISRLHAQIQRIEGLYYLQDLGSSNGTFINGNKIEANKAYLIEDGDKIAFAIAYSKNSIEYAFVE